MRTSIWLVRHGQTELNKARRYQGTRESPLTAFGERQAAVLAGRLRRIPFRAVIVSSSQCAQSTAETIMATRTATFIDDADWCDLRQGAWEGLTYNDVRAHFPQQAAARFADPLNGRAPGGESLAEGAARIGNAWRNLLQQHPGGRVLIVSHATPIQLVLCQLVGMPPPLHWRWRIDLGSITALDVYGTSAIMRMVNEVPH